MKEIAKIIWKSPSNIAFIKYWGKMANQIPRNPSLSMTLDKCYTTTALTVIEKNNKKDTIDFQFFFEGAENEQFSNKIKIYLSAILKEIPALSRFSFLIESKNSFPHSAGIASSASAMSALALCLATFNERFGKGNSDDFYTNASRLARLGSGSASRSVFGEFATWGKITGKSETSDLYATPFKMQQTGIFSCLRDTILLIDNNPKKVSSSEGHKFMESHPYAESRYSDAANNLSLLIDAMEASVYTSFANILEHEALSIHALMMTAANWYTLLHPNTLIAIDRIRRFREETQARICFTLDAGPNVHIIYSSQDDSLVQDFIRSELISLCNAQKYIKDNIGLGPELILEEAG